jgi:hypothetical protein
MLLCRGGNHRFILRCIVWLRVKTRLEARPTRTDSGAARTGGWTFHRIAPALGGCGNFDGRMEAVVFVEGGGRGATTDLIGGVVGWRRQPWECFALIAIG